MAHKQTDWMDHVVQYPKRITLVENGDGTWTIEAAPGEIIQQGTQMSATNFNNMEEGIGGASMMADLIFTQLLLKLGHSDMTVDSLADALAAEIAKIVDGTTVAKKASTLETARTIAISGGATGTATSFKGDQNITIPVTALDATKLIGKTAIGNGGTNASDAAGARANLDVPSNADLIAALVYADLQRSVDTAIQRDLEERLITAEAQIDALGS